MHAALRIFSLAVLVTTASVTASHAASCEAALKAQYRCTAAYDDGGSSEYCLRSDGYIPGDGLFFLGEDLDVVVLCTCAAKGKAPSVRFGVASRDFFCNAGSLTLTGKLSATRITGQGLSTSALSELRSSFTCQAVDTCP